MGDMMASVTGPKRVLLLGVVAGVVDDARAELRPIEVELLAGSGVEDIRSALREDDLDHVIVGGGLDLETRLDVVREVFQSSDLATVHLKDHLSGPEGFLPFVRAVLRGLDEYEPHQSPRAVLRARHSVDP